VIHTNMQCGRSLVGLLQPHTRSCTVQVFAEIAIIVMDEFTPAQRSWFAWRDVMHFMDIACCAAILFPIVWRIKHLREAAQTDGKAERCVIGGRLIAIIVIVRPPVTRSESACAH
jgi:hypothetical protein